MPTREIIEKILGELPKKRIGILGDLFLDRYLEIEKSLNEISIETGLIAYQVTAVRSIPGAVGTVINNLAALGVEAIEPFAIIGFDGEGYELRQALEGVVVSAGILSWPGRRTPTYTKPMLHETGRPAYELNRLDIKNRQPTPAAAVDEVCSRFASRFDSFDAVIVLDQVSEADCGVVTTQVRERIAQLGQMQPRRFILADSRENIHLFRNVHIKPNAAECMQGARPGIDWVEAARDLARLNQRLVFCTRGHEGIAIVDADEFRQIPAYPVTGPVDIVGAGDSCSAGIACAVACGCDYATAAAFGNLIASITIQQLGTTGCARPDQVRERWSQVSKGQPS